MADLPRLLSINDSVGVYMQSFLEAEVVVSQQISLLDPISLKRISFPCRSVTCHHLQCFDILTLNSLNQTSKRFPNEYLCPICELSASKSKVYLDYLMLSFLHYFPTASSLLLHRDGRIDVCSDSTSLIATNCEVINLTGEEISSCSTRENSQVSSIHLSTFLPITASFPFANWPKISYIELSKISLFDVLVFFEHSTDEELLVAMDGSNRRKHSLSLMKKRPDPCSTWQALNHSLMIIYDCGEL